MDAVYAVAVQVDVSKLMFDSMKEHQTCKMKKTLLIPQQQFPQQLTEHFTWVLLRGEGAGHARPRCEAAPCGEGQSSPLVLRTEVPGMSYIQTKLLGLPGHAGTYGTSKAPGSFLISKH